MSLAVLQDIALAIVTFLLVLLFLLIFICLAWYIIYVLILRRFKLVREIVEGLTTDIGWEKKEKKKDSNNQDREELKRKIHKVE